MAFKNRSVNVHNFAMTPKADVPRSGFRIQKGLKTSFDASYLVPVFCEEMLPGDTFTVKMTAFCRLATPLFPVMDNLHLESFFFFVPNRLVWENWQRFMGERDPSPDSSIDYLVPQITSPVDGWPVGSVMDYFGLPTVGQIGTGGAVTHSSLPLRAYFLIWSEWFRDENLQDGVDKEALIGDGPDSISWYNLLRRGKRPDYFTMCLPWPQKGDPVQMPLGTSAPVTITAVPGTGPSFDVGGQTNVGLTGNNTNSVVQWTVGGSVGSVPNATWNLPNLQGVADLSAATSATINAIRTSFQVQKLLERDARGGTRYTEIIRSHFGVMSPDARLQRPEYLGGGHSPVNINPVAQTSETQETPQGNLAAFGTAVAREHGFTQSFTEHGYVIGLVNVRADLTYQQGLRRHWSRKTRYDYYFPAFAHLGEQAVLNKEIYCVGNVNFEDDQVFGYCPRWDEYRYMPSEVTSLMRSTSAQTIDAWHYSERFMNLPVLNDSFIVDKSRDVLERTTAVGPEANGQQFIGDFFFDIRAARPLPMYGDPGLVDHF